MDSFSDDQLVDLCKSGQRDAFERLIRRHYGLVYNLSFKWTGNRQDAEDLAQDVFVKVAGKLNTFKGKSGFKTWLYRVAMNTAKDGIRKQANRRIHETAYSQLQETAGAEPDPEDRMSAESGLSAVNALPAKQKAAVILVFGEGMTHKQAAAVLNCSETTVSWRIFQARKRLKRLYPSGVK